MRTRVQRLEERCEKLNSALNEALDERKGLKVAIERQQAEIDTLVAWVMGERDALTYLQSVYNSPTASTTLRMRAAATAIAYERPKLMSAPALRMDFYERMRQARLRSDAAKLVIEHRPTLPKPN